MMEPVPWPLNLVCAECDTDYELDDSDLVRVEYADGEVQVECPECTRTLAVLGKRDATDGVRDGWCPMSGDWCRKVCQ